MINKYMRTFLKLFLTGALLLCFGVQRSSASHAAGADITYKWISGNQYQIIVSFYRDCAGILPKPASITYTGTNCTNNINYSLTLNLSPLDTVEITKACGAGGVTTCNGGQAVGIQRYRFAGTVTLPAACGDWTFTYNEAARNCAITTIVKPNPCNSSDSPPDLQVQAKLNNRDFPNNDSPTFSNIPITFVCAGQDFTYNHGVVDINGDSLVYQLINPLGVKSSGANQGQPVTYNNPYSFSQPVSSNPPVTLNSKTGDIFMHPTLAGEISIMAVRVSEYRNGVLIGSVIRDMQIYVITCSNILPVASGVNCTPSYNITACAGAQLCFNVCSTDPDVSQTVTMTWNSGVAGATFTTNTNSRPTGTFCWTPTSADVGKTFQFTVTVRDDACPQNGVQIFSYQITVGTLTANTSTTNVGCFGGSNGTATATPTSGTSPYLYFWSSGQTTQTVSGLKAGTYTVQVSSANGCSTTKTVTITQPPALAVSIVNKVDAPCGQLGRFTINASGGTPGYTYLTNSVPTQTTSTVTGLAPGTYTVTVSDANRCRTSTTVTIAGGGQINGSIQPTNVTCNGGCNGSATVNVTGATGTITYSWTGSTSTTNTATGLCAGTYSVTATSSGCTTTVSATVTEPAALTSTVQQANVLCNGGNTGSATINVSGGTGAYTYSWTGSTSTTNTATGLTSGSYTVTARDANNCTITRTFNITQPAALNATSSQTNVSCNGGSNGSITVTASGGTGTRTYTWTGTTSTTNIATNLSAGTYSVVIKDANNCSITRSFIITQPTALAATTLQTNVSCNNGSNGSATVNASGGTGTLTYTWTGATSTTNTASGLRAGSYSVVVRDANGCTITRSFTITQPTAVSSTESHTNIACNGANTGTITITASGGTPGYTYTWSPAVSTSNTASSLTAGNYTVTVRDANGCATSRTVTITQPSPLILNETHTDVKSCSCNGNTQLGSINLTVSGGSPVYTYTWTPAVGNGSSATNLQQGTYNILVRDVNGCSSTKSVTIAGAQQLSLSFSSTPESCAGTLNGTATVIVSGGAAPYTFLWSTGSTASSISGLEGNRTYNLRVKDALGCTVFGEVRVNRGNCRVIASSEPINSGYTVSVYPNPVSDVLNVLISGIKEQTTVHIELSDILGNKVYSRENSTMAADYIGSVNVSNLPTGVYILKLQYENETRTYRIVRD